MVNFLSSAQSVYFNQYFCLMCIYHVFLILVHTKSYIEKNIPKIRGHQKTLQKSGVTKTLKIRGYQSPKHSKNQGSPMSVLKKNSKNQGSPTGHPQGPSRLSMGITKRHGHQISSISCRFVL